MERGDGRDGAVVRSLAKQAHYALRLVRVQPRGRLVSNQQRR